MSEEKKGEASGIPVELADWNSHMDILSDVVQLPIDADHVVKDVTLPFDYVAPTYENGVANGFVGTDEEWNELVAKTRAEAPKEGYVEKMADVIPVTLPGEPLIARVPLYDESGSPMHESFASSTEPTDVAGKLAEVTDAMKGLTSLPQIFPMSNRGMTVPTPDWVKSLLKFYQLAVTDIRVTEVTVDPSFAGGVMYPADLRIFRYAGMDGDQEVTWFRFQVGEQSRSFVVLTRDVPTFLMQMLEEDPMIWTHQHRQSAKGFFLNVTQAPIELPLSFFPFSFEKGPLDDLFDGDFTQAHEVCERLNADLRVRLSELNRIALKLADLITQKDHDLYLSFKGVNGLKEMNVALDRVYPKLPESGEIVLGDEPINLFEWASYSKVVQVNIKRISHGTRQINRMFEKYRALINPHPAIQEIFDTNLKEQLMASSHFLNRVYGFSPTYGVKYMEEVANEVIAKLNAHGGAIGLDLNEWVVYEYHEEGRPTPIESEELDFKKQILNSYTQSFVDALYGYLLDIPNPYIKPYTYREVVAGDDGIEVGSIRQV